MRKILVIIFFISFCFAQQAEYAPYRVLLKFKKESTLLKETRGVAHSSSKKLITSEIIQSDSKLSSFLSTNKIFSLRQLIQNDSNEETKIGMERIFVAIIDSGTTVEKVIQLLKENPEIEYAEPDYIGHGGGVEVPAISPDDPYFSLQWGLKNTGQNIGGSVGKIGADVNMVNAWDLTTGDSSTILAVLDSGIPENAFDFKNRLLPGHDYANNDSDPYDDHGHGSNTTSVAAATGNNDSVMAGVNWKCRIMPLKILDQNNSGFYSWWASALTYAADHGANVISMSVGGSGTDNTLKNAIDYAAGKGCIIVACMMNTNNEVTYYPAGYANVISIGAVNNKDKRVAPFCWGDNSGSNYGNHIDFVAPGEYILGLQNTDPTKTTYWCGTSQATPIVSGLISLMFSLNKNLTFQQVYNALKATAKDTLNSDGEDIPGWDKYYGWGLIDAYAALNYVKVNYPTAVPNSDITNSNPISFSLSQNYPNPFNPETKISFTIQGSGFTSLKIFDVLGKETAILVNENLPAGTYTAAWDARNNTSGVYFYTLKTGAQQETKKMVLLR